ncbi:MAG: restriction endonuclease subunit S [Bacteroidia bacterium]|nr:restriction endonuclease subunit S [Bacteroidia bacterium]
MKFEKIGNVFLVIRNGANIKQDKVTDGYPITRIETIADGTVDLNRVGYASIHDESFSEFYLQENDILMSHINSVSHLGKVALVNQIYEKVIHGMNLLCLKADVSIINPMYSFYYFKSPIFRSKIKRITKKSVNQASFNISNLKDIEIPLPPLPDQLHIANLLSKAENLIAQRKESIRLLDEFLKSTFLEMFGDPVRNDKGWDVKIFGEFVERITKGESPKWQGFDYLDSGVRFITSENVLWGSVDLQKAKFIHEDFHNKLKRSQLKENDLLVNLVGASVGRSSLCPKEALPANINQAVAAITLNPELINAVYVMHLFINQSFQRLLLGNVVEAARANLSLSDLRNLKFPVPPLALQTQFAQIVEKTEALKTQYQQSLQELENLYGSLSQKAFRGELGVKESVK